MDKFVTDEVAPLKNVAAKLLNSQFTIDPNTYEFNEGYEKANDVKAAHTIGEMIDFADKGEAVIEAKVISANGRSVGYRRLDTKQFLEATKLHDQKFREGFDQFSAFDFDIGAAQGLVGHDFVPLLGGPFFKNPLYYDYIRMHMQAFYAYNHDPIARRAINMFRDFILGRGWRGDFKDDLKQQTWNTFLKATGFQKTIDHFCLELCLYGEAMLWQLPNFKTRIEYQLKPGQAAPTGLFPRFRLIDPSSIWDICTYPEDITRVLFYQLVAPTQINMYTGNDGGGFVPTTKFLYEQIPGDQVRHYKINCMSNEKRGRSDLMPVLGYLKRARDIANYAVLADQKRAAWAIDTTIEGSQEDLDAYASAVNSMAMPEAASEFAHTAKVKREYMGNSGAGSGITGSFEIVLSMIAAGLGVPLSYLGTHVGSGGSTRASAVVGTEPITKIFEQRQQIIEECIRAVAEEVIGDIDDFEVTFPELMSNDKSQKIKDINAAEVAHYISHKRAMAMVAKELGITDFDPDTEMQEIISEPKDEQPLTAPPTMPGEGNPNDFNGQDRHDLNQSRGY